MENNVRCLKQNRKTKLPQNLLSYLKETRNIQYTVLK